MKLKKILAPSLAALILIGAACTKNIAGPNNSTSNPNFDEGVMLTNIGNNVLLSGISTLSTSATSTATAINAFSAKPGAASLTAAQAAWDTLAVQWATCAPFDIGPMNDNLISANIDTWPANDTKIESAISAKSAAANVGADTKGLKALEYLLFDKGGNAAVLAKYAASDSVNRKAFLNSVAMDLATQAGNLQQDWKSGYLASFTTAKGNDVSSSVSQMINAISLYLDNIKTYKIGQPIGMGVKVNDNQPHPELIEYTIAEESIPVMKANVQAMKAAFDGGNDSGLDDLLNSQKALSNGQNLSAVVDAQFNDVLTKLNALTPPYATAVGSQTQQVQAVFNSLKILIAYFKVDIANNLGVTITFTDTDGD